MKFKFTTYELNGYTAWLENQEVVYMHKDKSIDKKQVPKDIQRNLEKFVLNKFSFSEQLNIEKSRRKYYPKYYTEED